MMTQIRGSSNAKAKRELGWEPACASWRDGSGSSRPNSGAAERPRVGPHGAATSAAWEGQW